MTTPTPPIIPYAQPPTQDDDERRGRMSGSGVMFGFGVVLIVFGGFIGLVGGLLLLDFVVANRPSSPAELRDIAPAFLAWAVVVTAMIWTGIGSVRRRRWARVVVLSVSGMLISLGVITLLVMIVLHVTAPPSLMTYPPRGGGGERVAAVIIGILVLLVALPLL